MKLETKFNLKEKVKIIELLRNGIVKSFYYSNLGFSYNVRYFDNGEAKEIYFYEDELEKI